MESLYQEIILDHYRNPVGRGLRVPFDAEVHQINPTCGDEITLRVQLGSTTAGPILAGLSYQNQGCSISQASASVMYELIDARPLAVFRDLQELFLGLMHSATNPQWQPDLETLGDAVAFTGVAQYPARIKCALLPWMACVAAISQASKQEELA